METTKLSSKGQIIIPKMLREANAWEVGQEFIVTDVGDGVLLKVKKPFEETSLDEVVGCLQYDGEPKSLAEMDAAIAKGAREQR